MSGMWKRFFLSQNAKVVQTKELPLQRFLLHLNVLHVQGCTLSYMPTHCSSSWRVIPLKLHVVCVFSPIVLCTCPTHIIVDLITQCYKFGRYLLPEQFANCVIFCIFCKISLAKHLSLGTFNLFSPFKARDQVSNTYGSEAFALFGCYTAYKSEGFTYTEVE
jgi:hypothetical protein